MTDVELLLEPGASLTPREEQLFQFFAHGYVRPESSKGLPERLALLAGPDPENQHVKHASFAYGQSVEGGGEGLPRTSM